MEDNENNKIKDEIFTGHKPVSIKMTNKVMKSICKIIIVDKKVYGTGFFMKIAPLQYLITNYHVINQDIKNYNIQVQIWNQKYFNLTLKDRFFQYFEKPKDITVIEIKDSDYLFEDIEFLGYDSNYMQNGYYIYKDLDVFSIEHPFGEDAASASGKIIEINGYEFNHSISTEKGSSGCPILINNNNINLVQVIGIHKNADYNKKLNGGTFIGEIINELNENITTSIQKEKLEDENYITAEIFINENNINKDVNIIHSIEGENKEMIRGGIIFYGSSKDSSINQEKIKGDNVAIKINDELIPFSWTHQFKKKGKFKIKYIFKKSLRETVAMFYNCHLLINIDLSNFNSKNLEDISGMFCGCSSLTNINFSNLDTKNVKKMKSLFYNCSSLKTLDLSNFITQNVENFDCMFYGCSSLVNLNLSNFNTENAINMPEMFYNCKSLIQLDLSNFRTQKVKNMGNMFSGCSSLLDINLSNFNTQNVTNMQEIFYNCKSLKSLNLSNFNTQNVENMGSMFAECSSLESLDLSNFNTQNATSMYYMFENCKSLKKLDIYNFNTQNVKRTTETIYNEDGSTQIISVPETDSCHLFSGCISLKRQNVIAKDNKLIEEIPKDKEPKPDNCLII